MNIILKLSPRLNSIFEWIQQAKKQKPYDEIWDCCCDHGYLGINILSAKLCEKLIFVDQLPHIIKNLQDKLQSFEMSNHEFIVADAGNLKFDSTQKHLVILAGVGGECSVDIIQRIEKEHKNIEIDYIICPSASQLFLRKYLHEEKFNSLDEKIVCEKNRCYEIFFVSRKATNKPSLHVPIKCDLWKDDNKQHQAYLKKINGLRGSKKPKRIKEARQLNDKNSDLKYRLNN